MQSKQCVHTLAGHSYAVCVLILNNNQIITGSQDKHLRFWEKGEQKNMISNAHMDIIRELCEIPDVGFLSCSNDQSVKM